MLLLPLLVCLVAGPLTGAVGGEPPAHPGDTTGPSITTRDPTEPAITTRDPTEPATTTRDPIEPATTTRDPTEPATTTRDPTEPATTTRDPTEPATTTRDPIEPATTTRDPTEPATTTRDPTEPATTTRDPTTETATTVTPETAETGGREGGSEVQEVNSDPNTDAIGITTTAAAQPDGDHTEPPAHSGETTTPPASAAGGDGDADTTAAPETDDQPTTVATTAAADEHLTMATEEEEDTTTAPPTDAPTTTPAGRELDEAPLPEQPTLSRHRADPGLAPSETKTSKARTGVLDLEMLDNRSKPRKGAPPSDEGAATSPLEFSSSPSVPEGTPATDLVPTAQTTASSFGGGFFGEDTLTGSSSTVRPKPAEASDAAGDGPRGLTVAAAVILVLLLVVIGFFVFRKVRETWYRRHYRKMDFLVDGMYNL